MTCIAGTRSNPKVWFDRDDQEWLGRPNWCGRMSDRTSTRSFRFDPGEGHTNLTTCQGCPLFRGVDAYGIVVDGRTGLDSPPMTAWTEREHQVWEDEGWDALERLKDVGHVATLADYPGVTDALDEETVAAIREYRRERARKWRREHPGADRRSRTEYRRCSRNSARHRAELGLSTFSEISGPTRAREATSAVTGTNRGGRG